MSTSIITIEADSPPIVDSSDVVLPTNTDWLSDYEYYEFELPTFTALPPVFTFAPAEPEVNECVLDTANLANEFVSRYHHQRDCPLTGRTVLA